MWRAGDKKSVAEGGVGEPVNRRAEEPESRREEVVSPAGFEPALSA